MLENEPISQDSQGLAQVAPAAREAIKQGLLGPGMRRLTTQRESAYMDLKNSGRLKAATVVNFNPISLKVEDGHVPWRVPSIMEPHKSIEIEHSGRRFKAAFFTVREPSFVPWIRDVRKPSDEGENANAEYDAKFILPIELVDQYRIQYTSPQFTPMGGVLAFEGDIHALMSKKMLATTIRVPSSSRLPDGTRSYFSQEMAVAKELAATLDMQKAFCTHMIQQADEYDQDDQARKNITPVHRLWHQFAIDMGWKTNAARWMSAVLETENACKGCGKAQTRTDAWFCTCGRPYNALAAFLAGEPVPEAYIFALSGKELEQAQVEMQRRNAIRAMLNGTGGATPVATAL